MFVYRDRPVHPDATANPEMTFSNLKYFIHVMPQVLTILFPTPIKMKNVSFLQELIKLSRHNYSYLLSQLENLKFGFSITFSSRVFSITI